MAQKPVARVGDAGSHGGVITSGSITFTYEGVPVARVGDTYDCPEHGPNPIVTGAPSAFDQMRNIAVVGSKTACGATIITGAPTFSIDVLELGEYQGMGFFQKPVPGKGIPHPVLCTKVAEVKKSAAVREKIQEALKLTNENKYEYGGWIIEDPKGNYYVSELYTSKEKMWVTPTPKPPNAIGNFHTHPNAVTARPSTEDEYFAAYAEDKCLFYLILGVSGDEAFTDDNGDQFGCPDQENFVSY